MNEPSSTKHQKDPTNEILEEIKLATKRGDEEDKAYVCHSDLRRILSESRIYALFPDRLTATRLHVIESRMIAILSTLVSIGASKDLARFFPGGLDGSAPPKLTDDDLPLNEKQLDLVFSNSRPVVKSLFLDYQFRFKPVVINERKLVITDPKRRLPFESQKKDLGAGSYGTVDCVGISQGYFIRKGWTYESTYLVACKKIILREDFKKEADNLDILDESLTSHDTVMKHLATIVHGSNCYILLPYARLGDLELFLHCGVDPYGTKKYDFDSHFKGLQGGQENDIMAPLLRQCWSLASALAWLHKGIKIVQTSRTVFCAHMDLKPANILIEEDPKSPVGKWMISDFGISVFKEGSEPKAVPIGSIRDYYSQLTINTKPKRPEGTYQAPDVKREGIGRKSDIWSYGCIFIEVLAFALGRAKLVREFQSARDDNIEKNDYFYSEARRFDGHLSITSTTQPQYIVRPSVSNWLDNICAVSRSPQRWVDCYVGTAKKILVIDVDIRPNASKLSTLVDHVLKHVLDSRLGPLVDCPVLHPKDEYDPVPSPPQKYPPIPFPSHGTKVKDTELDKTGINVENPVIVRTNTFEEHIIHNNAEVKQKGDLPIVTEDEPLEISAPSPALDLDHAVSSPNPGPTDGSLSIPETEESALGGDQTTNTKVPFSTNSTAYVRPENSHGLMTNTEVVMSSKEPIYKMLTKSEKWSKATSVSVTSSSFSKEIRVAYLVKTVVKSVTKSVVYLYKVSFQDGIVETLEKRIPLKPTAGWTGVVINGDYLAVWGFSALKKKLLHFCDVTQHQNPAQVPSSPYFRMLEKVAVSKQGIAALICGSHILILTLNSQVMELSHNPENHEQNFTSASFNDSGDLLFAWAYGQKDSMYVWRCKEGVINKTTETESHYGTIKKGRPFDPFLTTLLPYSTSLGCIIRTSDQKFFPAHIRSSVRGSLPTLSHNHEVELSHIKVACVFNDYCLVAIESEMFHRRLVLKEYKILWTSLHTIEKPGDKITKLNGSFDNASALCVVKTENEVGGGCAVIVCNLEGGVEVVKFIAEGEEEGA